MPKPWKPKSWLLFIYKVPSEPVRKRTFVWRRLNRMHALYLQQAVCLLPDLEENASELESLAERIREFEGESTLLRTFSKNEQWEREIQARLESGKTAMFEKLREEIQKFVDEILFEEHRKRFTIEEVEELEQKFEALDRWFEKLKNQDGTSAHQIKQTQTNLKTAAVRLEDFATQVERFKEVTLPPPKAMPRKTYGQKGRKP